jgi:bifunctional N-acetylglucosamine-1-phosphate-uridyltransferase/glucosamine-1-phosphate-acetyltransferase GlmU-like protein
MTARDLIEAQMRRMLALSGRSTSVDPELSTGDLIQISLVRGLELVRGLLRFRRKVYCGTKVRIRGRSGLHLGKMSAVGAYSQLDAVSKWGISLADGAKIGRYVTVTGTSTPRRKGQGLRLGVNSAIGDFAHVGCAGGVSIGNDVIIGPCASFHSQEHITDDVNVPIRNQGTREAEIVIGDDVWVGARVTFLSGSRVGDHSIVAAGTVVRGSYPDYSVIGGVPSKILKHRANSPITA